MPRILIVNNDIDTMTLLKGWLERKKYKVKYTGDAEEVPGLLRNFNPEMVLVDVLQQEVVGKLKTEEETCSIPVILMTGYTLREKKPTVKVDDVIEKPFNLNLLEKKIEKLIEKSS